MYINNKTSSNYDIMEFIEDTDIYNSKFLYNLDNVKSYQEFEISRSPSRLDLLSKELYETDKRSGILGIINRSSPSTLEIGDNINYITTNQIDNIRMSSI
jgi:hypothetical protein